VQWQLPLCVFPLLLLSQRHPCKPTRVTACYCLHHCQVSKEGSQLYCALPVPLTHRLALLGPVRLDPPLALGALEAPVGYATTVFCNAGGLKVRAWEVLCWCLVEPLHHKQQ
jgi:hypothetical protein